LPSNITPDRASMFSQQLGSSFLVPLAISYLSLMLYRWRRHSQARHVAEMLHDKDATIRSLPRLVWPTPPPSSL